MSSAPAVDKIEQQRIHFNEISERYHQGRQEETHIHLKNRIWQTAFAALPEPTGAISVLEPMCGYAEGHDLISSFYTDKIEYHGFDYSDEIVAHMAKTRPQLGVAQCDVTKYQAEENSQDLIIIIGGLHHVPNQAVDVVQNMARALKPGGIFLNFEPTAGNPVSKAIRDVIYKKNDIFDEETERAFGVGELRDMFLHAGLKSYATFYPGLLAYVMYYNPYAFPLLNKGGKRLVDVAYGVDKLFYKNVIGRTFSFATLGIWQKPL